MIRAANELVDAFASVLDGVLGGSGEERSESALARRLDCSVRLLAELRRAGLLAPRRLGRGWVYDGRDVRVASVLVALVRLGAVTGDLALFLGDRRGRCRDCTEAGTRTDCAAVACCEAFLDRLRLRTEDEIDRLHRLDGLLVAYAADARAAAAEADLGDVRVFGLGALGGS